MGDRGRRRIDAEAAWHILIPANRHSGSLRATGRHPLPLGSIQRGSHGAIRCHILTTLAASPATALDRLIDTGNDHWVEVTGEGSVNAAPDFARVTLGVTNTGKTAGEAMAANAKAANALVSLIKSEGVAPADIQTSEVVDSRDRRPSRLMGSPKSQPPPIPRAYAAPASLRPPIDRLMTASRPDTAKRGGACEAPPLRFSVP